MPHFVGGPSLDQVDSTFLPKVQTHNIVREEADPVQYIVFSYLKGVVSDQRNMCGIVAF